MLLGRRPPAGLGMSRGPHNELESVAMEKEIKSDLLSTLPPQHLPGKKWEHNNNNYVIYLLFNADLFQYPLE